MYASLDRLGVFYFVPFLPDVILSPIDHPSLRDLGAEDLFKEYYALGGKPITSRGLWLVTTYQTLNYFETRSFRIVDRTIEVGRYETGDTPGKRPSRCSGGHSFQI